MQGSSPACAVICGLAILLLEAGWSPVRIFEYWRKGMTAFMFEKDGNRGLFIGLGIGAAAAVGIGAYRWAKSK